MNSGNEFLDRLLKLADDSGWFVLEYQAQSPGWIVIEDMTGTRVRIESHYGLDLPYYLEHFKARPRDTARVFEP